MTGSAPTPQAMTLEEAMQLLATRGMALARLGSRMWQVYGGVQEGKSVWLATAGSWAVAVSAATGQMVVERDPAAELAQAAHELLAATEAVTEWQTEPMSSLNSPDPWHEENLRRSERHANAHVALRAALAAYEASRK